jgi:16S rRNA (adenine1518-N6/adenine1519-N6)-dimethyltransferase
VVAIERDDRCLPALDEIAARYPGRLAIVHGDALAVAFGALAEGPTRIVANLPYNIATPLLIGWLRTAGDFAGFTLMLQREVAQRLAAPAGSPAYGRLTVFAQWHCEVEFQFAVDRRAFVPPPRVTSAVVNLTPRPRPLAVAEERALETVTRAAFGQRRKMLRSSLRALGIDAADAGIDPTRRAEQLSVAEFCALARLHAAARGSAAQAGAETGS